jgi:HK97 family phage major capsid protein
MKTSVELKQERKSVSDKIDALKLAATTEKRSLNTEESAEMRGLLEQESNLTKDIELAMELEVREAKKASEARGVAGMPIVDGAEKEMRQFSIGKLVQEATARGASGITGFEKEMIEESSKEARSLGVNTGKIYLSEKIMDVAVNKRTQTAQTGNVNLGNNLIPTEKVGFYDALWAKMVLGLLGVERMTGLSANTDLNGWDTAPVAYWAAENGTQSPTDATIANRPLRPNLLGSAVDISMLLKIQTNGSVDSYFMDGMLKAMAVAYEAAVINGDGSDKPTGILSTSGIQNLAIGTTNAGAAPSLANILALVSLVESANANLTNGKFLINPKTVAKLKQTDIGTDTGAKILAYNQYFGGVQNVIDGYATFSTTNVPSNLVKGTSAAVNSAIIFGDFSQVVTAQFGGLELSIDEISAAMRRSGKYALTANMYVDSAVKQPAALGAILDATTT